MKITQNYGDWTAVPGKKNGLLPGTMKMQKMQQRNHKYKKMPQGSFLLKKQKLV